MTSEQSQRTNMDVEGMSDETLSWVREQAVKGVTENDPQSRMYQYSLAVGAEVAREQAARKTV